MRDLSYLVPWWDLDGWSCLQSDFNYLLTTDDTLVARKDQNSMYFTDFRVVHQGFIRVHKGAAYGHPRNSVGRLLETVKAD